MGKSTSPNYMNLPEALDVEKVKKLLGEDAFIIDMRPASLFTQYFIPGSVFFGLDGRITEWAGDLISSGSKIVLVTEPGRESESMALLNRYGIKDSAGFLEGGADAWQTAGEPSDMIIGIEADELMMDIPHDPHLLVIDVRRSAEFDAEHLEDALNIPLEEMGDVAAFAGLEERQNLYVHCSNGYRSVIAASILKKHGFHNLRIVTGGWEKIRKEKEARIAKENNSLN